MYTCVANPWDDTVGTSFVARRFSPREEKDERYQIPRRRTGVLVGRRGVEGQGAPAGGHRQARAGGAHRNGPLRAHGRGGARGRRGARGRVLQGPGAHARRHHALAAGWRGVERGTRGDGHGGYEPPVPGRLRPHLPWTGGGRGPANGEPLRGPGSPAGARGGKRPEHHDPRRWACLRRIERAHQSREGRSRRTRSCSCRRWRRCWARR